ncbi:MAG: hypothetical protein ACRC62_05360 [Microcoleus sp.]
MLNNQEYGNYVSRSIITRNSGNGTHPRACHVLAIEPKTLVLW